MSAYHSESGEQPANIAKRLLEMADIEMANWLYNEVSGRYAQGSSIYGQLRGLARAYLASAWQPIETAPRDGTKVLVWASNHAWREPEVAYWGRSSPLNRLAWIGGHCSVDHIDQPTRWMPLPDPPK